ncbi:MAG: DnaJ domain-containing protein [Clostridiales bacterium]|jgi:hypothetical protein|nr:DnaJ domain-containing protein [Clostridiales bacterium]
MTYDEQIKNAFNTLGLKDSATEAQVDSAYKKFAKKYHPDLHMNDTPENIDKFNDLLGEANNAREILQTYFELKEAKEQVTPEEEADIVKDLLLHSIKSEISQIKEINTKCDNIFNAFSIDGFEDSEQELRKFLDFGDKYIAEHTKNLDTIADKKGLLFRNYEKLFAELEGGLNTLAYILSPDVLQYKKSLHEVNKLLLKSTDYCLDNWNEDTESSVAQIVSKAEGLIKEANTFNYNLAQDIKGKLNIPKDVAFIQLKINELVFLLKVKSDVPDLTKQEIEAIKNKPNDITYATAIRNVLENRISIYPPKMKQAYDSIIKNWDTVDIDSINKLITEVDSVFPALLDFNKHLEKLAANLKTINTNYYNENLKELKALVRLHAKSSKSYFLKGFNPKNAEKFDDVKDEILQTIIDKKLDLKEPMEHFVEYNNSAREFLNAYGLKRAMHYDTITKASEQLNTFVFLRYAADHIVKSGFIKSLKPNKYVTVNQSLLDSKIGGYLVGLFKLINLRCEDYAIQSILKKDIFTTKKIDKFIKEAEKFVSDSKAFYNKLLGVTDLLNDLIDVEDSVAYLKEIRDAKFNINDSKTTQDFIKGFLENPINLTYRLDTKDDDFFDKFTNIDLRKCDLKPIPSYKTFTKYLLAQHSLRPHTFTEQDLADIISFAATLYDTNVVSILKDDSLTNKEKIDAFLQKESLRDGDGRESIRQKLSEISEAAPYPPQQNPRRQ